METSDARRWEAVVCSKWLQKPAWIRGRKTGQTMRLVRGTERWRSRSQGSGKQDRLRPGAHQSHGRGCWVAARGPAWWWPEMSLGVQRASCCSSRSRGLQGLYSLGASGRLVRTARMWQFAGAFSRALSKGQCLGGERGCTKASAISRKEKGWEICKLPTCGLSKQLPLTCKSDWS